MLRSLTISHLEPFLAEPTQFNNQLIALQLAVASYSQTLTHPLLKPHNCNINWAGEISEDGQNVVEEVCLAKEPTLEPRLQVAESTEAPMRGVGFLRMYLK